MPNREVYCIFLLQHTSLIYSHAQALYPGYKSAPYSLALRIPWRSTFLNAAHSLALYIP